MRMLLVIGLCSTALLGCSKAPPATVESTTSVGAPSEPTSTVPTTPKGSELTVPAKARSSDHKLTVAEFEAEVKKDPKAARAKYEGKVIELSGLLEMVNLGLGGKSVMLSLKSSEPNAKYQGDSTCFFNDFSVIGLLGQGQTVKVQGKVKSGLMMECVLIEKGPDTIVPISAERLAKEYSADPQKTLHEYKDRTLKINGEAAGVHVTQGSIQFHELELKGDGKTVVACRFGNDHFAAKCKPGVSITLIGKVVADEKNRVILSCLEIPVKP